MQIALHLGAHCTDDDRLLKCLRKNADSLAEQGINVPEMSEYRPAIRDALSGQKNELIADNSSADLLQELVNDEEISRVVLSHPGFLGVPRRSVENNLLYNAAPPRIEKLRAMFEGCDAELFISLRDPASFVPAAFDSANEPDFAVFLEGSDPLELRWSNMIMRLRQAVPDAPITVWCNEDTPLIWNDILREMSGHDPYTVLQGRDDFLGELMVRGGVQRMQSYFEAHPPKNETQRRRVVVAFLDKFALPDALEEEVDLPGWTEEYMGQLTELYDTDVEIIGQLPGVRLLTP